MVVIQVLTVLPKVCFIAKKFLFFWFKFQFWIIRCIWKVPSLFIWKNYVSLSLMTLTFLKRTGSSFCRLTLSMDLKVSSSELDFGCVFDQNTCWQCCGLPKGITYGGVWWSAFCFWSLRNSFLPCVMVCFACSYENCEVFLFTFYS